MKLYQLLLSFFAGSRFINDSDYTFLGCNSRYGAEYRAMVYTIHTKLFAKFPGLKAPYCRLCASSDESGGGIEFRC